MAAEEASPAIVLRARDYSESDRIVTLLTRDAGKLGGIAKGAKVSRRRFERKLEPFSHVMLYFRRRLHGELVFITRAEASGALAQFNLGDDLGKFALGSYMLELADALTSGEADAAGAYHVLSEALETVTAAGVSAALRQAFELRLLGWAGFGLEFARCRGCEARAGDCARALYFVAERGGVVCARCQPAAPEGALKLAAASAQALANLSGISFAAALSARPAGPDGALAISRFLPSVIDRRLRSAAFLDSIIQGSGL